MSTNLTQQEIQAAGHSRTMLCCHASVLLPAKVHAKCICSQPGDFTPPHRAPAEIPPPVLSLLGTHAGGGWSPDEKRSGLQGCALAPSPAVGRWQRGLAMAYGCCSHGRFRAGYGTMVTGIGPPAREQHCWSGFPLQVVMAFTFPSSRTLSGTTRCSATMYNSKHLFSASFISRYRGGRWSSTAHFQLQVTGGFLQRGCRVAGPAMTPSSSVPPLLRPGSCS